MRIRMNLFVLSALIFVGAVVAVCLFQPGASSLLPPCPFYRLTGYYCPGCGSTRMLYHLVHGEPGLALRQNPLAFLCLPFVMVGLIQDLLPVRFLHTSRIPHRWLVAFAVLVVLYAVARNLPQHPWCELAPGGCPVQRQP